MPSSTVRSAAFKPLTLPRSLSRVLSRLMAMPHEDSLPLAKDAHTKAACPRQRNIAMRLRVRLLQEALHTLQHKVEDVPEPIVEVAHQTEPTPEAEPTTAPPTAKVGKLISMDLEGGALAMMMQGLGNSEDDSDDFFSED